MGFDALAGLVSGPGLGFGVEGLKLCGLVLGLGSGLTIEGLTLLNGSMRAKMGSKSAQMEPWRIQNDAQWPKMEARRGPNATPRASEKH